MFNFVNFRLTEADRLRKSDVAECKMRYDSQMAVINNEINQLQGQVTRFKRERDNYKHMLEGAQKTIGDLKVNSPSQRENRNSIASFDEVLLLKYLKQDIFLNIPYRRKSQEQKLLLWNNKSAVWKMSYLKPDWKAIKLKRNWFQKDQVGKLRYQKCNHVLTR